MLKQYFNDLHIVKRSFSHRLKYVRDSSETATGDGWKKVLLKTLQNSQETMTLAPFIENAKVV